MLPIVAIAGLSLVALQSARAQVGGNGIGVNGAGEVTAKPDTVELKLRVSGAAELTDDAIVKHRDARDRVMKAFEGLKLENMKVDEANLSVHSGTSKDQAQLIMRGMPQNNNPTPPQVEVTSVVRIRLQGIDKIPTDDLMKTIGKLLDTAKDSGAAVGPSDEEVSMAYRYGRTTSNNMVRFVVTGVDQIREAAYQKAAADAKERAERLAKLHGLKLGPVLFVQESFVSGDSPNNNIQQSWDVSSSDQTPHGEINSDSMTGAVFQVKLAVRFGIERADKTQEQTSTSSESHVSATENK
ncbi:MAG TPA: SIMPL domain-containing protein [Pirellulales bacterium]|jgi:uncharacterized protein YggE|nr:SIMPL domain-containing protein [Pirellulales bacterium]